MVILIESSSHQEPALLQVILSLRIDTLERRGGRQVCVDGWEVDAVFENHVVLVAVKIGNRELRSIVLITRLNVECAYRFGYQIWVSFQPGVIQERFIQAGCAVGAAIQSFESDMR